MPSGLLHCSCILMPVKPGLWRWMRDRSQRRLATEGGMAAGVAAEGEKRTGRRQRAPCSPRCLCGRACAHPGGRWTMAAACRSAASGCLLHQGGARRLTPLWVGLLKGLGAVRAPASRAALLLVPLSLRAPKPQRVAKEGRLRAQACCPASWTRCETVSLISSAGWHWRGGRRRPSSRRCTRRHRCPSCCCCGRPAPLSGWLLAPTPAGPLASNSGQWGSNSPMLTNSKMRRRTLRMRACCQAAQARSGRTSFARCTRCTSPWLREARWQAQQHLVLQIKKWIGGTACQLRLPPGGMSSWC